MPLQSYVTVEQADARLGLLYPEWNDLGVNKERLLIRATELLDDQPWLSSALDPDQPHAWPRLGFTYHDPSKNRIVSVLTGEIPERVVTAVTRLAEHLARHPDLEHQVPTEFMDSISVGPLSVHQSRANANFATDLIPYRTVLKEIEPLLARRIGSNLIPWRAW